MLLVSPNFKILGKQLTEQRTLGRELEIKEQTLQKTKLRLKELEYLNDSYNEFKQQAKVYNTLVFSWNDFDFDFLDTVS